MRNFLVACLILPILNLPGRAMSPRPRIWLSSSFLADLASRVQLQQPNPTSPWNRFKSTIDGYLPGCNLGTGGTAALWIPSYGAAYRVQKYMDENSIPYTSSYPTSQYGSCAKALTLAAMNYYNATCSADPEGCSETNPPFKQFNDYRNIAWILAVGYDWLYDLFSAEERAAVLTALRQSSIYAVRTYFPIYLPYEKGQGPGGNLYSGYLWSTAAIGYATYGDNPTDDTLHETNQEISEAASRFENEVVPFFNSGFGLGGALPEGPEYSPQVFDYYLRYCLMAQSATGVNLLSQVPNLLSDAAYYTLHSTSSTTNTRFGTPVYEPVPYGDLQGGSQFLFVESTRRYMLELLHLSGDSTLGRYVKYWLDYIQPEFKAGTTQGSLRVWNFLYLNSEITTVDYRTQIDTDYFARGGNTVISRSSWSSGATWFQFFSGQRRVNHQRGDVNGFQIYREGTWLTLPEIGYGGWWQSSHVQNTITYLRDGEAYYKGPIVFKSDGDATITKYKKSQEFVYLYSDATAGYRASSGISGDGTACPGATCSWTNAEEAVREMVYVKPDFFVVLDRLRYRDPTRSRFQLMTTEAPTVDGAKVSAVTGTQKIVLHTLSPSDPVIGLTDMNQPNTVQHNATAFRNLTHLIGPGGISATDMAIPVVTGTGGASNDSNNPAPQILVIDGEKILASSIGSTSITVAPGGRGYKGTTAAAHAENAGVYGRWQGWRTEILTAGSSTSATFLHVLEAADAASTPAPVSLLSVIDDGAYGVLITADVPRLVILSKGSALPAVHFTATFSGTGKCIVTGLAAGTYQVKRNGGVLTDYQFIPVGSDGVLYFESAAGAFSVESAEAAGTLTVTAIPTLTKALLRYGHTGLSAQTGCTVEVSTDPSFSLLADGGEFLDGGGRSRRAHVVGANQALDAASTYYYRIVCGSEFAAGEFATLPSAPPQQRTLTLSFQPPAALSAASIVVDYGETTALGSQASAACAPQCSVPIPVTAPDLLYYRWKYLDAAARILATSQISPLVVP